jgi:hypothetical protein
LREVQVLSWVSRIVAAALASMALALAGLPARADPSAPPTSVERIELARFRIVYTSRAAGVAGVLAQTLEPERDELARRMGRDWQGTTDVFVGDGQDETVALAPPGMHPPPWAAGIALPSANTLLLDARALRSDEGRHVLRHELAHLALGRSGTGQWPRWFQEGFAMLVAGEWSVSRYAAMYRASARTGAIPLSALADAWPERLSEVEVAYAQSFSFVSFIYEKQGEPAFRDLIGKVADGARFDDAFRTVYGTSLADEEAAWRKTLARRYSWVPLLASPATQWIGISLLFILVYLRVRHRSRARMAAMELEEKAQEAALRIALAEQQVRDDEDAGPRPAPAPEKPVLH